LAFIVTGSGAALADQVQHTLRCDHCRAARRCDRHAAQRSQLVVVLHGRLLA
jgi:hypothetical protein